MKRKNNMYQLLIQIVYSHGDEIFVKNENGTKGLPGKTMIKPIIKTI